MRTRLLDAAAWCRRFLFLLLLCHSGFAASQAPPAFSEERPPWLAMVARTDPADPANYIGVYGDELSGAVAFFRDGARQRTIVPQVLQRGDELETGRNVIAVIRYPIGDVYIDAGTRVRIGSLDVLFGKVFAKVRGFFSVENQNVVAGVEGTEFAFEVAADGTTQITVLDGIVLSSSKKLPWKPLRVTRNQAFTVTEAGRQMRVGAATPAKLAQLRMWVQHVDNAVAALAPREPQTPPQPPPQPVPQPPPAPQPQPVPQPVPQPPPLIPPVIVVPIPPVTVVPSGYCCDPAGEVYPSTVEGCRGRLYATQAEAYRRCVRLGHCCAGGRVFESGARQCDGVFSFDRASVIASCRRGYCCANERVTPTTQAQCGGRFFANEASAKESCAARGYCCVGHKISRVNSPAQCSGKYSLDEGSAKEACAAPPPLGYCCTGGKVTRSTRDRCGGTFSSSQAEAQRVCKVVQLEPKPDSALKSQIIKKPPPDGPVVR